ncbi:hypothetical protein PGTUg99_035978 [Puccinia graminis f. sp. tritici]|uniref:Uncharacterized protein n=1 Tax=Puccinia graminis f. sp. tritici TaxID=56615 RepID=A0A5B0PPA6_PUCGR|nr:hypothetical protein PGTUg99_024437 [Puccinia graminis f. sp. tritici]KAA1102786.1 hypothetical protein PGTUg99_035978 [Puccinia graminis f. sp. tritici]
MNGMRRRRLQTKLRTHENPGGVRQADPTIYMQKGNLSGPHVFPPVTTSSTVTTTRAIIILSRGPPPPHPERLPPKAVTSSPAQQPVPILLLPFSTLIAPRTTTIVMGDKSSQILCFSPLQGLPPKVV